MIATSEGRRQEQINVAIGAREAAIAKSEGEKQADDQRRAGRGRRPRCSTPRRTPKAIRQIADAIQSPGGLQAVNLKVAEHYINAFGLLARTNNTLIVPSNVADIGRTHRRPR